jgi:hypothetical protein
METKSDAASDISDEERNILLLIAYWMNGNTMLFGGEQRQIATHRERPLKEMLEGTGYPNRDDGTHLKFNLRFSDHKYAHEQLIEKGFLREQYVCRRKIDWVPTEQGLRAIHNHLKPWSEYLRPDWANDDDSGPLFGDPNEGLLHRKGVEILVRQCRYRPWTDDGRNRPGGYPTKEPVERYPNDEFGNPCHDLHVSTVDYAPGLGVEIITENNNYDYLLNKWERFSDKERNTIWVFDGRETACKFFNKLDRENYIKLDRGQFDHFDSWSAQAINNKIERSIQDPTSHRVHTINGLFKSDEAKLQALIDSR